MAFKGPAFHSNRQQLATSSMDWLERADVEAQQSLEVQLAALQTWETYIFGRLKTFKVLVLRATNFAALGCLTVTTTDHMSGPC